MICQTSKKPFSLLIGGSGAGKSKLLDAYIKTIVEDFGNTHFVGYYDQTKSLKLKKTKN